MERFFIETKVAVDDSGVVTGRAWQFGVPDWMGDEIEPSAFKGIKLPLPMLFGHDKNDPVGTWDTAEIKSDGLHLAGKMLVDEVPRAREVMALVKAGAVSGLSIGFLITKPPTRSGDRRLIRSLKLFECSLVTVPMHPGARVTSAKSAVDALRIAAAINRAAMALSPR